MPSPSEIIMASLGLQADLSKAIARNNQINDTKEYERGRQASADVRAMTASVKKARAEEEVSQLEALFSGAVATGKPGAFGRGAMNMELSSPEAIQARAKMSLQARELGRENVQDQRAEAIFGLREAEANRAAEAHRINMKRSTGLIEDEEHARERRAADEAYEDSLRTTNLSRLKQELELSTIELNKTQEGREVINRANKVRNRIDDAVNNRRLNSEGLTRSEVYDIIVRDGAIGAYFDPDDPLDQLARRQFEHELRTEAAQERADESERLRLRQETIRTHATEIEINDGGEAEAAGKTAVMDAIKGMEFNSPDDFAAAYTLAESKLTEYLDRVAPEGGLKRSILKQIGIQSIGQTLDKSLARALSQTGKLTPEQRLRFIAGKEKFINNRLQMAQGTSATPLDRSSPEGQKILEAANRAWMHEYLRLEAGELSPQDVGIGDDTSIPTAGDEAADQEAADALLAQVLADMKKNNQ